MNVYCRTSLSDIAVCGGVEYVSNELNITKNTQTVFRGEIGVALKDMRYVF